jgi:hypothetical protein
MSENKLETNLETHGRYMAVTSNYFGIGADVPGALKAARAAGWRGAGSVLIYHFQDPAITGAWVEGIGNVTWTWGQNARPTLPVLKYTAKNERNAKAGKFEGDPAEIF